MVYRDELLRRVEELYRTDGGGMSFDQFVKMLLVRLQERYRPTPGKLCSKERQHS